MELKEINKFEANDIFEDVERNCKEIEKEGLFGRRFKRLCPLGQQYRRLLHKRI